MNIERQHTDDVVLRELGKRIELVRLQQNLTQAALAERAGVSTRTLQRLESGAVATALTTLIRVCRELGLLERLDDLIPVVETSPMDQLKTVGLDRQRARAKRSKSSDDEWTWGDET